MNIPRLSRRAEGTLLTLLGVLVLTPDGLLVRLAATDPWTLTFCRSILVAISVTVWHRLTSPTSLIEDVRRSGIWDHLFALGFGLSGICFVVALWLTTVANVLVINSLAPAIAALLGRWLFGRRLNWRTWAVILVCIAGIAVIAGGEFGALGAESLKGLIGIGVALASAILISLGIVARERCAVEDPRSGMVIGALVVALLLAPFASPDSLQPAQLGYIAIMSLVIVPVAFFLMFLGPRYIAGHEVSLIALLETVLGPVWVWLVMAETPGFHTWIGGALVLGAMAYYFLPQAAARPEIA